MGEVEKLCRVLCKRYVRTYVRRAKIGKYVLFLRVKRGTDTTFEPRTPRMSRAARAGVRVIQDPPDIFFFLHVFYAYTRAGSMEFSE